MDIETGDIRHVTPEGVDAVQPHWSPGGHRIAYWSSTKGIRDIWTVPAEGGEAISVTRDSHVDWNPVWSRDGRHLYFLSDRGGTMSLWRAAIDERSGNVRSEPELVMTTAGNKMRQLSISGNGRHLAYATATRFGALLKIAFDPETETVIGEPHDIWRGSRVALYPQVSPDGKWVAFTFQLGGGKGALAIIRPDGTDLRHLTDDASGNVVSRWSHDGEAISFYSNRSGSFEVWSIRRDGGGLRRLTDTPESNSSGGRWSPDGALMAFYSDRRAYIFDPNKPWDEQTPQELPPGDRPGFFIPSEWSPDGRTLAGAWHPGTEALRNITFYDRETNAYRIFPVRGEDPNWLADGRRLLYWFANKIFLMDSESGEAREILSDVGFDFSVSRDNRWIYFSRLVQEADIWMLTLDEEES